jgi:hypothetical protein
MKVRIIFIILLNIYFCERQKIFDPHKYDDNIYQFKNIHPQEQAKFINRLSINEKINFLAKYLPDSTFDIPVDCEIKFFTNGEVIFDWPIKGGGYAGGSKFQKLNYYKGIWKIKGNKIIIEKKDNKIPIFKKKEVWSNVIADQFRDGQITLELEYIDIDGNIKKRFINYQKTPTSYAIKEYSKIVKTKELNKLNIDEHINTFIKDVKSRIIYSGAKDINKRYEFISELEKLRKFIFNNNYGSAKKKVEFIFKYLSKHVADTTNPIIPIYIYEDIKFNMMNLIKKLKKK